MTKSMLTKVEKQVYSKGADVFAKHLKDAHKHQSNYSFHLKVNDEDEMLDVVQEENVQGRNAIKIKFFRARWRTPKETIALLKKVIDILESLF